MMLSLVLTMLGTFFFAISGSMLAARRGFDIIGSLLLGSLTGLGGGVVRDVILGRRPSAFEQPIYLVPCLLAAVVVYFSMRYVETFSRTLLVFDAAGLALFCTTGTTTALNAGMNPIAAALLGVTTGVGGGLLRDVVANRDPQLFNPHDLYAVPAMLGAALTAAVAWAGWPMALVELPIAVLVFVLRVLSLRFHWRVPGAVSDHYEGRRGAEGSVRRAGRGTGE